MTKMKKFLRRIALILAVLFALGVLAAAGTNAVVMLSAKRYFLSNEDAAQDADFDAIVVFGCGVTAQGTPTYMLRDRLETAAKSIPRALRRKYSSAATTAGATTTK